MRRLAARVFRWLLSLFPSSTRGRDDTGFFTRYVLIKTRRGCLFLHEFHRSDLDHCLHDHPWDFWTLVLWGGYSEQMGLISRDRDEPRELGCKTVWRAPGYFGRYPAEHAHRIEVDPSRPLPWSLVWIGRKTRPWGFWTIKGWVEWQAGQGDPLCESEVLI